jgi:hypothetical protein
MWKDNIDQIVKRYKRFLKENGIYKRAISIHMNSYDFRKENCKSLSNLFSTCSQPDDFLKLISKFCVWAQTPEGRGYWWALSLHWREICLAENFENLNSLYLKERYKKFLKSIEFLINEVELPKKEKEIMTRLKERVINILKEYEKE